MKGFTGYQGKPVPVPGKLKEIPKGLLHLSKKGKSENSIHHLFCSSYKGSLSLVQPEGHPQAPSPRTILSISTPSSIALNVSVSISPLS